METPVRAGVLVGLTGSIGAGKSLVADVFRASGIPVLEADVIARELMTSDATLRAAIIELLGPDVYDGDVLDRKAVAQAIFGNPDLLKRMNALVHPRTIAEQNRRAQELFSQGKQTVACEAALIFESGGEDRFDYLVVVDADRELRLKRAAERDGSSIDDIRKRDESQFPSEKKVARADFVIRNNGSLEEAKRNASFVATLLQALPPRVDMEVDDDVDGSEENHDDDGD